MDFKNLKLNDLYRGSVPFFLSSKKGGIIFLASSNKNIEDYYYTLKDFYKGNILMIDDFYDEFDTLNKNYNLLEILKNHKDFIILISLQGILEKYTDSGEVLSFEVGKEINLKPIEEKLINSGYSKNYIIENKMEFSIRGDILDIFPLNVENPIRIELFGDEVDRISEFDSYSQKSISEKENISVYITKANNKKFSFFGLLDKFSSKINEKYLENIEILKYKLEENILKNRENENLYRGLFKRTDDFTEIESKRFDFDKIKKYEDLEVIKKESQKQKILILSEEKKRYDEIFEGYRNIKIEKYPHYEGFKY